MAHRILVIVACLAWFSFQPALAADAAKLDPAQIEFFEKKVRPVLVAQCLKCHGPEKQKGGLRLDSPAAMRAGGDSGPAMVAGKPDASLLIKAIRYNDTIQMPPGKKLAEDQIAALTAWVQMGAPWPAANNATRPPTKSGKEFRISDEDRAFWSFQAVKEYPQPEVRNAAWARSTLDPFILAKLEANGLVPVPAADKRTWLRRASFDVTGLPPTPGEIDDFLRDDSPDAFAKVADRLLSSPHFGERWARHWLDVARYGEDQAHSFQPRLYPNGYRYRDWVVKAINSDMPYDRFLTEQIAGDLIDGPDRADRLAALGYFALGPHYYGKAIADELDDRVDTLCRGMLGLTVACARCHDHKFDPIPTRDYYSLAGIFASTDYKEYPVADAKTAAEFERAQAAVKEKDDAIRTFLRSEWARWSARMVGETARYMVAAWKLTNQRKEQPTLTVSDFAKKEKLHGFVLERWVAYLFPKGDDNRPHLASWREAVKGGDGLAIEKAAGEFQEKIKAIQAKPEEARSNVLYKEILAQFDIASLPLRDVEKLLDSPTQKKLKAQRAEVDRLKKALPKIPTVHSLTESAQPANLRVYLRGNPATPGDEAPRRFLDILSGSQRPLFLQGSGRLELARAIASKDNPLTARVIVNRVWTHYFGKGIVATPSNFGRLGARPTHPELLDHLAARFMAGSWSLKKLHRDILLSSTYRLSSQSDSNNQRLDPANTLCWRMERRRLEVEPWRDALLAVAGNLDRTMGGPSVNLASPDNRRRTLYAAISRHNLDGLLRLFDFPDPNITADRRPVTTVPLQQLFVLNSDFMVRQSKALAARLTEMKEGEEAARIQRAFLLLYGRPPSEAEVELGIDFLKSAAGAKKLTAWEQYAQVLLSANEFVFVD